jgi:hypothetical protein
MLRGTIIELQPNDAVTVQLPNGETRKVSMSEVTYAGPAKKDPAVATSSESTPDDSPETQSRADSPSPARQPKPYATIHADQAHVELHTAEEGLTFHLDTDGYTRLCTAPCSIDVPVGYHRFGLSRPDSSRIARGDEDVDVHDGATVSGTYVDRSGWRALGWVFAIGSMPAGLAMELASIYVGQHLSCVSATDCATVTTPNSALIAGGLVTMAAGLVTGIVLITRRDYATFVIESGAAALAPLPAWAGPRREGAFAGPVPGLTATLRL